MMSINLEVYTTDATGSALLYELISDKKSFRVTDIKDMSHVVSRVEKAIKSKALSSRVYTAYPIGTVAIPTGVTQAVILFSAIVIGLHNLVTYSPDYELGKNKISKTLSVIYKK